MNRLFKILLVLSIMVSGAYAQTVNKPLLNRAYIDSQTCYIDTLSDDGENLYFVDKYTSKTLSQILSSGASLSANNTFTGTNEFQKGIDLQSETSNPNGSTTLWNKGNSWVCFGSDKINETRGSVIKVAKDGSGNFTTIQAAIDSITGASSSNRYTVLVYPGVYAEQVTLKQYVSLTGTDKLQCRIVYSIQMTDDNTNVVTANYSDSVVSNLYIENTFSGYASVALRLQYGAIGNNLILKGTSQDVAILAYGSILENSDISGDGDTVSIVGYATADTILRRCRITVVNSTLGTRCPIWIGNGSGTYHVFIEDVEGEAYDSSLSTGIRINDGSAGVTAIKVYINNSRFYKVSSGVKTLIPLVADETYGTKTTIYQNGCMFDGKGETAYTLSTFKQGDLSASNLSTTGNATISGNEYLTGNLHTAGNAYITGTISAAAATFAGTTMQGDSSFDSQNTNSFFTFHAVDPNYDCFFGNGETGVQNGGFFIGSEQNYFGKIVTGTIGTTADFQCDDFTADVATLGVGSTVSGVPTTDNGIATKEYVDSMTMAGNFEYWLSNTASAVVGTYKQFSTSPVGSSSSVSASVTASDQLIEEWITETAPGITTLAAGVIRLELYLQKTTGTQGVYYYGKLYKRTTGGTETLLSTSNNSIEASGTIAETSVGFSIGNTTLDATDRLVVKIYATPTGSGTAPTIAIHYGSTYDSHIGIPLTSANYVIKSGDTMTGQLTGTTIRANSGFNYNGTAGVSTTVTVISALQYDVASSTVQEKHRTLTISGGIITSTGTESEWATLSGYPE